MVSGNSGMPRAGPPGGTVQDSLQHVPWPWSQSAELGMTISSSMPRAPCMGTSRYPQGPAWGGGGAHGTDPHPLQQGDLLAPSLACHCRLHEARWTWKCGPGLAAPSSLQGDTLPGGPASIRDLTVAVSSQQARGPACQGQTASPPGPELRPLPGRWRSSGPSVLQGGASARTLPRPPRGQLGSLGAGQPGGGGSGARGLHWGRGVSMWNGGAVQGARVHP